ncbi:hypothetical protein M408DRAFT_330240 [Serendipita vermifera MAFF 305830]|uniref:Uncharacterized protein n=1 Tax=Serendipita vermifera MAFF 305830 TaxID=933852 RepID=A0A0C3ARF8_SERVB|nr:hypothetical protein M408DRAFT_330240 [Serendipita vermifera MAFF 305830]
MYQAYFSRKLLQAVLPHPHYVQICGALRCEFAHQKLQILFSLEDQSKGCDRL